MVVLPANASHVAGADMTYTCTGNNTYQITLTLYRDCCGISLLGPETVQLFNGCTNTNGPSVTLTQLPSNPIEISSLCTAWSMQTTCATPSNCPANPSASIPTYPGIQKYSYTGTVTLPSACSEWYFRYSTCCRNATISNGFSNEGFGITCLVNNTADPNTGQPYNNSSPAFTTTPVDFICRNELFSRSWAATDAESDSLGYELVNPLNDSYLQIPFSSPWNANYPISTNPANSFQFDEQTGYMEFTPSQYETDGLAMRVSEYRNGVLVGSVLRDMQIYVFPCSYTSPVLHAITNVQNGLQLDSVTVQVCPNTTLQFNVTATDAQNHLLLLTSDLNSIPSSIPSALLSVNAIPGITTATISWTPVMADTGCHYFTLTAQNDDCPIKGSVAKAYRICVTQQIEISTSATTYCGTPITLTASGGANFFWTPSSGANAVLSPSSYVTDVQPQQPTTYYFNSDCGNDSVFIDVVNSFTTIVTGSDTVCAGSAVQLSVVADTLEGPYTYLWTPPYQLYDVQTGLVSNTVSNPLATPLVSTTYYCYTTDTNGCVVTDSVEIEVIDGGLRLNASAQPDSVAAGTQVQLFVAAAPVSSGYASASCTGVTAMAQLGYGFLSLPPTATQYPTIYGRYRSSARHQFLYRKAELSNAAQTTGFTIDSLSFYQDVAGNQLVTLNNFEIKIGTTTADSLTDWQPNTITVFTPKPLPVPNVDGWVTHALDFAYDWNGRDNLVIEFCFYNSTGSSSLNSKMLVTPTTYPSVYYSSGNFIQCGVTGVPQRSFNRPNTRFHICKPDLSNLYWTPDTGVNAAYPSTVYNPVAYPEQSTIYHVDVTQSTGCVNATTVAVEVDTSFRFYVLPADTFLCQSANLTLTTKTYGGPVPDSANFVWLNITTGNTAGAGKTISILPDSSCIYVCSVNTPQGMLTDTVVVTIGGDIPLSFQTTAISCFGLTDGELKVITAGGLAPFNYLWSNGNVSNEIQNLSAGTYSVTVTDALQCSGSANAVLTNPAPFATATVTQNGTLLTAGPAGYSYQWYYGASGNNPVLGANNVTYTAPDSTAEYCVAVSNGICEDTACILYLSTGLETDTQVNWAIYPNPNDGAFSLKINSASAETVELKVMNAIGELVDRRVYETHSGEQNFYIANSGFASGVYFIQLKTEKGVGVRRMVVR